MSLTGSAGHRAVEPLSERGDQALEHAVGDERPRGVVHQDQRSVLGHLRHTGPDGVADG